MEEVRVEDTPPPPPASPPPEEQTKQQQQEQQPMAEAEAPPAVTAISSGGSAGGAEEESETNNEEGYVVLKRKRTKRQRVHLQPPPRALFVAATSASTTSSTSEFSAGSLTEEEEDMANCLILLARGRALEPPGPKPEPPRAAAAAPPHHHVGAIGGDHEQGPPQGQGRRDRSTSRRFTEAATTDNGKGGFYMYECKTCGKCFPSFQALGGHRTSHKKPKTALAVAATMVVDDQRSGNKTILEEDDIHLSMAPSNTPVIAASPISVFHAGASTNTNTNNSNKSKVHECAICGAEFTSGQALGGHMRRHRPTTTSSAVVPGSPLPEPKKPEIVKSVVLTLDLNLPAPPEVDDRRMLDLLPKSPPPAGAPNSSSTAAANSGASSSFPTFPSKPPPLLSTSAMVDCHY